MHPIQSAITLTLLVFAGAAAAQRAPAQAAPVLIAAAASAESGKTAKSATQATSSKRASTLRGEASWYGARFAGKKTASGERFSPKAMTAAHPSLPFGTRVRVTNLDSDQSAVLTINDRLPRKSGRVIDVTKAAAEKLGFVEDGTTPVRIDVLRRPTRK